MDIYTHKVKAVVIRHRSGHKVIAMIEIVSPGDKDDQTELKAFVEKAHPGPIDRHPSADRQPLPSDKARVRPGIHRTIWDEDHEGDFALTDDKPLTCVSYVDHALP